MMLHYTEEEYATPLNNEIHIIDITLSEIKPNNNLSLTPLWEYCIRAKCLPDTLDLDRFFSTIHTRLNNPEWEVRQHGLRVLVDCIPIIPIDLLDIKIKTIFDDIIKNLGHASPAVWKGAIDSLRAYINRTDKPNEILTNLIQNKIVEAPINKIQKNIVLGIILGLPYLINNNINSATITYVVHKLLDELVKGVHLETVLRSLVQVRDIIGNYDFNQNILTHETFNSIEKINLLCKVYDLHVYQNKSSDNIIISGNCDDIKASDIKQVAFLQNDALIKDDFNEDTVILETEILLDSGSAITMKIHEESPKNSLENGGIKRNQTFKVLPDYDSNDYEYLRRTPRRVRFGGEIIKLRTPDSDSNQPSDDDRTISITSEHDKPTIEIKYIENEIKARPTSRIPIPLNQTQSAPNSPHRNNLHKSKIFKSSPNLGSKSTVKIASTSRIPRRYNATEVTKTIEIKITDKYKNSLLEKPKYSYKNKPKSVNAKINSIPTKNVMPVSPIPRRNSREDEFSPIPIHNEIEVIHNLTRTPSPNLLKSLSNENLNNIKSNDNFLHVSNALNNNSANSEAPFTSFQVYNSKSSGGSYPEFTDSPIPTKDAGECLTCSSSGSETVSVENKKLSVGVLNNRIVEDLENMDDIRARQRGLEELLRVLQTPGVTDSLEDRLSTILYILFSAEQQPILQQTAEQSLNVLFTSMSQQALLSRLQQIALNLSKTGSPLGVRLAILLMKRIPPRLLVDQLIADSILGAKSSKIREGSLQILMTVSRMYPSTDINIPKSVMSVVCALNDRKRKVRQAALEALAALAQLSSASMVIDVATETTSKWIDQEQILKVIRTRLSRKQLPTVNVNGYIRYSTPTGESEVGWLSKGSGVNIPISLLGPNLSGDKQLDNSNPITNHKTIVESNFQKPEDELFGLIKLPPTPMKMKTRYLSAQTKSESFDSNLEININRIGNRFEQTSETFSSTGSKLSNRFGLDNVRNVNNNASATKSSFWRNHSRLQMMKTGEKEIEDMESDWSRDSIEESIGQVPQIWASDPTFLRTDKAPMQNVYLMKQKGGTRSAATNTTSSYMYKDETLNKTPLIYKKTPRGRSFSPPTKHPDDDDDSNDEHHRTRFVNANYERETRRTKRELHARKSYSSEHLTNMDKFRWDVEDSECSSGSSVRQNWNRNLRSGIPVPITGDTKLRIRNRSSQIPKGPMSTPYSFASVKSPSIHSIHSLHSTPDKITLPDQIQTQQVIGSQPFSSGSESSGYFTPPAESHLPEITPQQSPVSMHSSKITNPPRFIQIESPQPPDIEENFTIIDSEIEIFDDENDNITIINEPDIITEERKKSAISLDQISNIICNEEHNEAKIESLTNSLDEIDFSQINIYSENKTLSKSEIDIQMIRQNERKNINSAPAIACIDSTYLPGSINDLEDTEAPDNMIIDSPVKIAAKQIIAPKSPAKRKSGKTCNALYPDTLKPFPKAREGLHDTFALLENSEWENIMKGLNGLVRLIRHHPDVVENQMHAVCVVLGKHIRNLRSQVARAACLASSEMFSTFKRSLEVELDELANPLLQRTADTNKFLRCDANAALDEMCANMSIHKVISVVSYRGAGHQNAIVRCAAARILCNIVHRLGPEKCFQLPKDTRDKILLCGANMLTEGSLETRKHAKLLLGQLAGHCQFQRTMEEVVPSHVLRHIDKQLRALM